MRTLTIVALLLLTGCATAAQRQYQAMETGNQALLTQLNTCARADYNAPEAAPIRRHIPLEMQAISPAQLSNPSFATNDEIPAIVWFHDRVSLCRKQGMEGLVHTTPSFVPIFAKAFSAADDDTLLLIQRKMAWGEVVRRARDRVTALAAELEAEHQRIAGGLQQQHGAEVAARQQAVAAAGAALQSWALMQQMQAMQLNARNQTTFTNCTYGGGYATCTSR